MTLSWAIPSAIALLGIGACSSGTARRTDEGIRLPEQGQAGGAPAAEQTPPPGIDASPDPECSLQCQLLGLCHAVGENCVAQTEDDCRNSDACRSSGRCTLEGTACVLVDDEDCRASQACASEGRCSDVDGECVATSAMDCRASAACRQWARCSVVGGECAVAEDADCRESDLCAELGLCFAEDGFCAAKLDADCLASVESCRNLGRCAVDAGHCVATEDADCAAALTCMSSGACTARDGVCAISVDADCRSSSLQCGYYGRCASQEDQCVALDDAECRASALCAAEGRCFAEAGGCVAASNQDCERSQACDLFQRCVAEQGVCVVARSDCADGGACSWGTCLDVGECSDPSHLDCVRSRQCAQQGLCVATASGCEASPATCAGSQSCETRGRCIEWNGMCHTHGDVDADCRGTNECLEFGWCSSVAGVCVAARNSDCEPSAACITSGFCAAFDGRCVVPSRHGGSNASLESPPADDPPSSEPPPVSLPVSSSPGAWSEPRVADPAWRLPVSEGRLAFPPLDTWQDRRVHLPAFKLDETEVTIARLRSYLEWAQGRPPVAGAGATSAIEGSGWDPAWDEKVSLDVVSEQLRLSLTDRCEVYGELGEHVTYEDESVRPANCISWYTALALCISEGGRLPTIAEWTYAAEGGAEGRLYPWGDEPPTQERVAMDCLGDGQRGCSVADLLDAGSRPLGAGRWGHLDLAGSLEEWLLDALTNGAVAHWTGSSGFELGASRMAARAELHGRGDDSTDWYIGARCASE